MIIQYIAKKNKKIRAVFFIFIAFSQNRFLVKRKIA